MTDSTEQAEAHRLITEALGDGASREYERRVVDLVFAATAAFGAGEKAAAGAMLAEHVNGAEDPDLASYHVCVAAALVTGHLLDGDMVRASAAGEGGEVGSLLSLAVQLVNSASVDDETTMALILDVIWHVDRGDIHQLAAMLLALRAEVVDLDEGGDRDDA